MLFNSTLFLAFLVCVVALFYQLKPQGRRGLLLVASYAFYWVWSVPFSLLLVGSTMIDFWAARFISAAKRPGMRRLGLVASLVFNLGVLGLFKYADFFSSSTYSLFGVRPWPELNLILPLGISFYTFQTMSYTIDVYRGNLAARKSIVDLALYVSFFPQLVAGPIVRAGCLIPQLDGKDRGIHWLGIRVGIGLIAVGMLKKVFVGDPMGIIANQVFSAPERFGGWELLLGTYAFAIQIYCDFSGYSDIAIGSAALLGISLPKNFDHPYLSCSITAFWRRWHISLSTWLRDYLYVPLGGNRAGRLRTYINLMITMLLGGLWHGAGWNWVVWGGLQGAMLSGERIVRLSEHPRNRFIGALRWALTMHLVCLSWVFFRAEDLAQSLLILKRMLNGATGEISVGLLPALCLGALLVAQRLRVRALWLKWCEGHPRGVGWAVIALIIVLVMTFAGTSSPEFIYFQF